jgi:4-amino-4-deoxy-L-arabinose transferase-like glycosyltransferase
MEQNSRATVWLASIIVFGVLLRLLFFVGLVSGDPQDDGIYYSNAVDIYRNGFTYLDRYRALPDNFEANPIDQFTVRPLSTYPLALAFWLFGPGEAAATLWSLGCSTLSIIVAYRLAAVMAGTTAGLLAAVLIAIYPLDVVNATRILSDGPIGLFCGLGLLYFLDARAANSTRVGVLAGVVFGLGYLANPRALLVLGCVVVLAILWRPGANRWRVPLLALTGFGAILLAETAVYWWMTGKPFLALHIHNGANTFKYLHEPVSGWAWPLIDVRFTNGTPLQLFRAGFHVGSREVDLIGPYFYLFAAALAYVAATRKHLFVAAVSVALLLYLEFGFVGIRLSPVRNALEYWMVFKQERFLTVVTVPLVALSACLLASLYRRHAVIALVAATVLAIASLQAIRQTHAYYRNGLSDLRTIASDIRAQRDRIFYSDLWAVGHLRLFTQYRAENLRVMNPSDVPYASQDACVILGGGRGVELLGAYVESTLPAWAREWSATGDPPPDWTLVRQLSGRRTPFRPHDLRIYCHSSAAARAPRQDATSRLTADRVRFGRR